MNKTEGSVIYQSDGFNVEKVLFTYNENDKQENEINAANANLVFSPKFIPFYPSLFKDGLNHIQILIYGFIDFYISNGGSGRFYFTNRQLGDILNLNEQTISNNIGVIENKGLIKIHRKMKSGGGQIRFIQLEPDRMFNYNQTVCSNYNETTSSTITKPLGNNNKINNNSIKDNKINSEFDFFWDLYDKKVGDKNKCIKKFSSLKQEDRDKIMKTLPAWLKQFSDKQFQPYPEKYLNQNRWNDELGGTKYRKAIPREEKEYSMEELGLGFLSPVNLEHADS